MLERWHTLRFSPAVKAPVPWRPASPKRAQRQAAQALAQHGVGTKAQQALAAQRGQNKEKRQKNKSSVGRRWPNRSFCCAGKASGKHRGC